MAKPKLSSLLVFGVHWGPSHGSRGDLDRLAGRLLDRLQAKHFKATWGLPDPTSSWVPRLRASTVAQEVALDASQQTPRAPRSSFVFAAWLRDQVQAAEQQGLAMRSLILNSGGCVPFQAVAKLGFRMVRPGGERGGGLARPVRPEPLRYGVWGLPISTYWPQPQRWLQRVAQHQAMYSLRRAAMQDAAFHLVFDLPRMVDHLAASLRSVDWLLESVAALRDENQIEVARLVDVEYLVRLATAARPAQSILRRAV